MIIAHVCHLTGWTWDYVEDSLTVPRLRALNNEWQRTPPVPLLLAALMGVKREEKGSEEELVSRLLAANRP